MNIWSILSAVAQAFAPKGTAGQPTLTTVEAKIGTTSVTFGQMQAAVALVENIGPIIAKLKELLASYGSDIKQDALVTDQIVELVAGEAATLGIPYAADIELGAYGLSFLLQIIPDAVNAQGGRPPSTTPIAGADWSNGPPAFPFPWAKPLPEPTNPSGEIGG